MKKLNNLEKDHYVVASNKAYCVGNQDGSFSPLGFHVEGKMSGIFSQPIRVVEGYTIYKNDKKMLADEYIFDKGNSIFHYEGFTKTIYALDDERAVVIEIDAQDSIEFVTKIHIEGCWTAEECGFQQGHTNILKQTESYVVAKHEVESWFVGLYVTNGQVCVEEDDNIRISINGKSKIIFISNNESIQSLSKVADRIVDEAEVYVEKQKQRRAVLISTTELTSSNKAFDAAFESLKINYDMLVQNLDKVGEGYVAGYPDFQWFFGCDTTYGIHGTLAVGHHERTKQSLRLLKDLSWKRNGNGRVIHEISPFGLVYNEGNLQETPHFISAVYETYKWTGDTEFLEEMIDFCIDGMEWVESKAEGDIVCPKGPGIVEVHGVDGRLIDIAILTINAYKHLEYMCEELGKNEYIKTYQSKREQLQKEVLEKFYSKEEEFFGDIICTPKEIKSCKDILINSIKNTETLTKHMQGYFDKLESKNYADTELIPVLLKNWIAILPYVEEFVPEEIKEIGLQKMLGAEFYNNFGMKLGCMCDDKNDPVDDIYTLNKSMSINTGYLAEVFAKNKHVDQGYKLLLDLVKTMNVGMPGAISEILPDDGCFMQFWSGYGIHHVFLRHILGIEVDAPRKTITIKPNLPSQLDYVDIKNLRMGECLFDLHFYREEDEIKIKMTKSNESYHIILK